MNQTRLTLTPDPRFISLAGALEDKLNAIAASLSPGDIGALLDLNMQQCLKFALDEIQADEGSIWIADMENQKMVMAFNTGPDAEKLVGIFNQPMNSGLISMVFANENPFMENALYKDRRQDKTLDRMLAVKTISMIAVPLRFLEGCRGIVSCVLLSRLGYKPRKEAFTEKDTLRIHHAAITLGQLIDYCVLRTTVGLS
jgi:hypothetical protein